MFRVSWRIGAIAGGLATIALTGLLALASQLTHVSFLPFDLADVLIRLTPGDVATFGIEAFGSLAKMAIEAGSVVAFVLIGVILGGIFGPYTAWSRRRPSTVATQLFALIMFILLLALQFSSMTAAGIDALTGAILLVLALGWGAALGFIYVRLYDDRREPSPPLPVDTGRRAFLQKSAAAAVTLAVGSSAIAELLQRAEDANTAAAALVAPVEIMPTPTMAAQVAFQPPAGVRRFITTADQLYTVASRTRDPSVDATTYRLIIDGAVKQPLSLSLTQLQSRPRVNQTSTLQCVSNEVGGHLIGNVNWNGTSLASLLAEAGLDTTAQRLVFHAAEGYVDSIPLDVALLPTSLVVYGIDGQPLPKRHGFPVRMIVPTIYGMKNVKWLQRIEVITGDFKGYWQERGWSNTAVVKTTSVVDTQGKLIPDHGIVALGGIGFAGDRGISAVEVRIDTGPWAPAILDEQHAPVQWRFWRYDWQATPGNHTVTVRAVDGSGVPQSAQATAPHPDGASGYHMIKVSV